MIKQLTYCTQQIIERIKLQVKDLQMTKSNVGSAIHSQHNSSSENILDPMSSNKKGPPKKLLRKNPLESSSKRVNVFFTISIFVDWEFWTNNHLTCRTWRPPHNQAKERGLELSIVIQKRDQSMFRDLNNHNDLC